MGDKYTARYSRNPHYTSSNNNNNNPSFSSTLLDAVYRSIDDNGSDENIEIYHKPMRKKQSYSCITRSEFKSQEAMANFQRACMIEKWMDKKNANPVSDSQTKKSRKDRCTSSSSSSDFSCGGGNLFSSSELETFPVQRPKPVRIENITKTDERKPKQENGFVKTKSKAMKIYDDLKKPISPGGKLAGFVNSLFNNGNLKRPKTNCGDDSPSLTCSSASSFSRSCLSKTPSSAGKTSNSAKRSVRFFDEQKSLHNEKSYRYTVKNDCDYKSSCNINLVNEEIMVQILEKSRRVDEVARDLLRNYQKKVHVFERDLDDDEDAESYASSDLFELDNLSAIGMEELPVYESTRLDTNRAIVSGMVL